MRTVVEKLAGDAVAKMFIHREILIFGVYGGNMSTGLPDETFRLGQHRLADTMATFVGDHGQGRPAKLLAAPGTLGRVAVVGSGPGGLAAAADLARFGAEVTVYEALHVVGGVLRYGIPAFRLPRDIIDKEVRRLGEMGVHFELNKIIGKTFTLAQLMQGKGFDAVFVAAGGYHHHMAMNTWRSAGAGFRAPALGLGRVDITLPDDSHVAQAADRLRAGGVQVRDTGVSVELDDPWGNLVRLSTDD